MPAGDIEAEVARLAAATQAETGDDTYLFLHIPKTAGTSLKSLLDGRFAPGEVCATNRWEWLIEASEHGLDDYRFFRGHLMGDFQRYLGRPVREFTFLREPAARAVSHYHHTLRTLDSPVYDVAHRQGSFAACLADEETRYYFSNYQTRFLATGSIPGEKGHHGRMGEVHAYFDSDEQMLDLAKARLEQMEFVGIKELFGESVDLLCDVFDWDLVTNQAWQNVDPNRAADDLPADLREVAEEANQIDAQLYAHALALFQTQRAAMTEFARREPEIFHARDRRRIGLLRDQVRILEADVQELAPLRERVRRLEGRIRRMKRAAKRRARSPWRRLADRALPPGTSRRAAARTAVRPFRRAQPSSAKSR